LAVQDFWKFLSSLLCPRHVQSCGSSVRLLCKGYKGAIVPWGEAGQVVVPKSGNVNFHAEVKAAQGRQLTGHYLHLTFGTDHHTT
jgi:hypothetical protein